MISVLSRLLWSRKIKYGDLNFEVNFMIKVVFFEILLFLFYHYALGMEFDI